MMTPEHRAAISLNNTGVALLQRRCYRQGFATLNDAVAAMSSVSRRINQQDGGLNDGGHSPRETHCMDTMLYEAAKRLAKPEPSTDGQYDLQVLSGSENPAVLASATDFSCKRAFLLQIESLDWEAASIENSYDLQASMILQNLGIAYRCMGSLTDDASAKINFYIGAMHLFALSYSVLLNSCESHLDGTMEETALQRFVFAASLILQNLVQLSAFLGLRQYGEEYSSRLETMRSFARGMIQDWGNEGFTAGAA
jgi:hypothetical protein